MAIARIVQRTDNKLDKTGLIEPITLATVMKQVKLVREKGYVYSRGTNTPGAGVIAMPLPGAVNGARLVIGIGGPIERLDAGEPGIVKNMKSAVKAYAASAKIPAPFKAVRLKRAAWSDSCPLDGSSLPRGHGPASAAAKPYAGERRRKAAVDTIHDEVGGKAAVHHRRVTKDTHLRLLTPQVAVAHPADLRIGQ